MKDQDWKELNNKASKILRPSCSFKKTLFRTLIFLTILKLQAKPLATKKGTSTQYNHSANCTGP